MSELRPYFDKILGFDHRDIVALDLAHGMFLVGSVLSKKPQNVLELGIGKCYVTISLIYALAYNRCGTLTSVDNWADTQGREPAAIKDLRQAGVQVVVMDEGDFVRAAASDTYDLLVADADHYHSHTWLEEYLRITQHDAFLFFHDTNQPEVFPGLSGIEERMRALGLPCYHFKSNSRADEHCDRGWLFVINKKR